MLEGLTPKRIPNQCLFANWRLTLEESDRQILDDAMASSVWSTHGLAVALRERGSDVTYQTLYRHRTKACPCFRRKDDDAGQSATG